MKIMLTSKVGTAEIGTVFDRVTIDAVKEEPKKTITANAIIDGQVIAIPEASFSIVKDPA